jgi:proline reductase-associated electron transfer protein PrdC
LRGPDDEDYVPVGGSTILERIEAAGVVGMGGAGFPTAAKLAKPLGLGGKVLLNAAECEPVLGHNISRIERDAARICAGLRHAMRAVGAESGIIAIKAKHGRAVRAMRDAISGQGDLAIRFLEDSYPVGEERAVIRDVLGVLLPPGRLPSEANCVVINAETAVRISDAVDMRKPVISKDMTIAGRFLGQAPGEFSDGRKKILLDVPTGISLRALAAYAGGLLADCGEIVMGGPFTGVPVSLDAPVSKMSGGLLAAMPFLREPRRLGLLVCACGAGLERLEGIAARMGAPVAGAAYCKQAAPARGGRKCENPGICPGQAEKVLELRGKGAEALLVGNCTDCTNTVMTIATKLKMPVYHSTDGKIGRAHV